jgi:hypothetical protein
VSFVPVERLYHSTVAATNTVKLHSPRTIETMRKHHFPKKERYFNLLATKFNEKAKRYDE